MLSQKKTVLIAFASLQSASFNLLTGADLSRAANLKGEVATTQVLIGRLHLLQGILAFHQGDLNNARSLVSHAEKEVQLSFTTVNAKRILRD